jgi:hypothetical protein
VIGLALALIIVGIIFAFVIPWVGIIVGLVGIALFIAFLFGFGRRASRAGP